MTRQPFGRRPPRTPPKLHLYSHCFADHMFASCGAMKYGDDDEHVLLLDEAQLVWLPVDRQCKRCHAALSKHRPGHGASDVDYETCDTHSATPLMLTTIEVVLHAFAAFCAAVDESGTHADRGCYHRDIGEPCWCGSMSLMDPNMGEWAIAALFGIADDGFVFRNVCERCHLSFRTKHPRGPHPVCGFCRGQIATEIDVERFNTGVVAFAAVERDKP